MEGVERDTRVEVLSSISGVIVILIVINWLFYWGMRENGLGDTIYFIVRELGLFIIN